MLWAKIGAGHAKLVLSYQISALHLFSDAWLYDHVVTSYVAKCFYELIWHYENYSYENLLQHKNQTFYEKFILQKFGAIRYT